MGRRLLALIGLLAALLLAPPLAAAPQEHAGQSPAQGQTAAPRADDPMPAGGWPVELDGEVLFHLHNALGPFSAEERAEQSAATILRIARDPFYSPDLLRIVDEGPDVVVLYRGGQVGSLTGKEAATLNTTAREMAEATVQVVKDAIARYRERQRPKAWLKGGLIVLGAAVVLWLLLRLLGRLHGKVRRRLEDEGSVTLSRLFKGHRSLPAEKLLEIELRLLRWGRFLVGALLVLVFLQVAFLALPFTHAVAMGFLHYVLDPLRTLREQFLAHVGDLFVIVVFGVLARWLLRFLHWLAIEAAVGTIAVPMVTKATAVPAYKVVRMVVIAVTAMMIYPYIPGSSTAAFKGVGLFAGALFTLGASGTASSLIGGVTLIFTDVYRVGDRIQIGEVSGDVMEVTLLITRMRTPKNEIVTLANGGILAAKIINYSREARRRGLILHTTVTIGYDVPWRRVHELLVSAAKATEGLEGSPEPFVLQTSLDDYYVSYQLNAYTKDASAMARTYSALHQNIQDAFHEAGVEIMSPGYTALRDGGAPALPGDGGKPADPRPFNVRVEGGGAS